MLPVDCMKIRVARTEVFGNSFAWQNLILIAVLQVA